MCSHEQPCFIFPVAHDGGFRRIPELSNHTESVYRLERFTGISVNQYTIWEALVISTVSGIGIINKIIYELIETEAKRLIFYRRHFQTPFPTWKLLYLYPNWTIFLPRGVIYNKVALVGIATRNRKATRRYMYQWWSSLLTHISVTRPPWIPLKNRYHVWVGFH